MCFAWHDHPGGRSNTAFLLQLLNFAPRIHCRWTYAIDDGGKAMRICSQYAVYLINLTLATVPYTCAVPPSTRPRTVSPAPHNAPASAYPVWLFSVAITIAARETSIHSHPYVNRFIPLRSSAGHESALCNPEEQSRSCMSRFRTIKDSGPY